MNSRWPAQALAVACEIRPPKSEVNEKLSGGDSVSFLPMEDLGIDQKKVVATQTRRLSDVNGSYTYFANGDVLLAKITPCFENGKLGIAENLTNGVGFGSSEYIVFRPRATLDRDWLYYFLSHDGFRKEGELRMGGAVGHKRVAKEFIESCPIPLPPVSEQRRIVGILDEAFDGVATAKANAEKNFQNARGVFESHLQSVFARRGRAWPDKTLGDVCSFENGDRGANYPSKAARTASGLPFINAGHLTEDGIDLETMDYISKERFDLLSNGKIRKGDVLFCLRGSLGKFACVGEMSEGAIASSLVIVRPDKPVLSEFVAAYFRSQLCSEMINKFKNGAAQPNLSALSLRNFVIPIPPIPAQRSIVERLSELRLETKRLGSLYQRKLKALNGLRKALLHQAFSGGL